MINPRTNLLLSLCVASVAFVGAAYGEEGKPTGAEPVQEGTSKVQDAVTGGAKAVVDPMRDKTAKEVDMKTATDIRQRLASVVNNAATKNGFDDVVGSLSKGNRDRIAENRFKDYEQLNAAIERFRGNFKASVGHDFDFKSAMLDDLKIFQGADKDHATTTLSAKTDMAAAPDAKTGDRPFALTGDADKDKIVMGLRAQLSLNLVNEGVVGNGWRLELMNPSAEGLSASLIRHLDMLTKDSIPKDADRANRHVARHILTALVDSQATATPATGK